MDDTDTTNTQAADQASEDQERLTATPENNDTDGQDTTPADPEQQRPLSPREEAMNNIVAMREQEAKNQEEQQPEAPATEPDSNTLTLKVDGDEKEITLEQAKAELQKNQAADKRLTEASRKQQQLAQWEQNLLQREQSLQQKPTDTTASTDLKETIQTAVDSLYDGETDEAVEALAKVLQPQAPSIDPQQISQQATQQVMAQLKEDQFETERQQGNQQFNEKYQDITSDPQLYKMANDKTIDLMQAHPDWSPTQIIDEAGRQTREWVHSLKGSGSNNSYQARMQRKSNLTSLPRSQGSVAYQQPKAKNGPTTPKQVIADMRQARGQA